MDVPRLSHFTRAFTTLLLELTSSHLCNASRMRAGLYHRASCDSARLHVRCTCARRLLVYDSWLRYCLPARFISRYSYACLNDYSFRSFIISWRNNALSLRLTVRTRDVAQASRLSSSSRYEFNIVRAFAFRLSAAHMTVRAISTVVTLHMKSRLPPGAIAIPPCLVSHA